MSTPRRDVNALCAAVGVAGLASLVVAYLGALRPFADPPIFAFFLVVLTVTYVRPLRLWHDGQAENVQLDEALFVPMALLLTPFETLVAMGGAAAIGFLIRRSTLSKVSFNIGNTLVAGAAGLTVVRVLGISTADAGSARAVAAAFVGGLVFDAVSTVGVAGIISVAQRVPFLPVLLEDAVVRSATYVGSLSLGVLVALAAAPHHIVLGIVIVPVAVLHLTYAAALGQWRERRRTEELYRAAKTIQDSMDSDEVRTRLVGSARDLLGAERAVLVPVADVPDASDVALHAPVDDELAIVVDQRVGGGKWDASDVDVLRALAGVATGALRNATLYEQLRVITSSLGEGVFAVDHDGVTQFMNPAAQRMLGWDEADLLGHHLDSSIGPDGLPTAVTAALARGETVVDDDAEFRRKDGTRVPVAVTAAPVFRDGQSSGAVVAFRDVAERKAFEEELAHQAFHDMLTGLPNRALFLDRLQHAIARSRSESGVQHALLFVDVDRFKVVNDSLGHQVGDDLLVGVAERLRSCVRVGDTRARFGGDEFTVLVEDMTDSGDALGVADRIIAEMRDPFWLSEREVVVSVSVGVASTVGHRYTPDELVAYADIAMYRAKAKGGDCTDLYDAEGEDRAIERLELEIALRRAIENRELEVYYQPVMAVDTERVTGVEALVRWNHPELGQVLPGAFISLAEETGLIVSLGRYVMTEALLQARAWEDAHPTAPPMLVSVNLSTRQLQRSGLIDEVRGALAAARLPATRLCLEITESVLLVESPASAANLAALKRMGVRLAIDDFGTGYSSLSYLKRFPVDVVKIDRSFITGLPEKGVDLEIVTAVLQLARAIGATVVAEGVETVEQLNALRHVGCPQAQGFYLARPLPRADVEQILADRWAPKPRTRELSH